jgi:hypothetical protein
MMNSKQVIGLGVGVVLGLATLVSVPMMFEDVDAKDIAVIQMPFTGEMKVVTEPGVTWQGFGRLTTYKKRNEFKFDVAGADSHSSAPLSVRFYDGGTAEFHGTISYLMPLDAPSMIAIHKTFGSSEALETQAIRRSMESASTFSGPIMTSFESAAGRRNELLQVLNDQTLHGVYKTQSKTVRAKDIAGVERDVTAIDILTDDKGHPLRAQKSYVEEYHVTMLPMTINKIKYEDRIEQQIKQQQDAVNAANVAKANAVRAEQDALTTEAQGKVAATKAKWEQEVANAKTVAEAQGKITIADANVKEAEAFKKAETLRGEGEAARKRAVMEADGQLDKKLEALVKINAMYADAIAKAQPGAWAPNVSMGGGSAGAGDRATGLVELLTAKTARDLGVDLGVRGGAAKK